MTDKYDHVLNKAIAYGVASLTPNELELFKRLLKENSPRGKRAQSLM